jgi:hypothetical protein
MFISPRRAAMYDAPKIGPLPRKKKAGETTKPRQPPPGKRVNPDDKVEEVGHESFPASDPPAHSPKREGPLRPAGEKPQNH